MASSLEALASRVDRVSSLLHGTGGTGGGSGGNSQSRSGSICAPAGTGLNALKRASVDGGRQHAMELAAQHGMTRAKSMLVDEERRAVRRLAKRLRDLAVDVGEGSDAPLFRFFDEGEALASSEDTGAESSDAMLDKWVSEAESVKRRLANLQRATRHVDELVLNADVAWHQLLALVGGTRGRRAATSVDERRLLSVVLEEAVDRAHAATATCLVAVGAARRCPVMGSDEDASTLLDGSPSPARGGRVARRVQELRRDPDAAARRAHGIAASVRWVFGPRRMNQLRRAQGVHSQVPDYVDESVVEMGIVTADGIPVNATGPAALQAQPWLYDGSGIVRHFTLLHRKLTAVPHAAMLLPKGATETPLLSAPTETPRPGTTHGKALKPRDANRHSKAPSTALNAGGAPRGPAEQAHLASSVWKWLQAGPAVDEPPSLQHLEDLVDAASEQRHTVDPGDAVGEHTSPTEPQSQPSPHRDPTEGTIPFRPGAPVEEEEEEAGPRVEPPLIARIASAGDLLRMGSYASLPAASASTTLRPPTGLLSPPGARSSTALDASVPEVPLRTPDASPQQRALHIGTSESPVPSEHGSSHVGRSTAGSAGTPTPLPRSLAGSSVGPSRKAMGSSTRGVSRSRRMAKQRAVEMLQRFCRLVVANARAANDHELRLGRDVAARDAIVEERARVAVEAAAEAAAATAAADEAIRAQHEREAAAACVLQRCARRFLTVASYRRALFAMRRLRAQNSAANTIRWWWLTRGNRDAARHFGRWWLGLQRRGHSQRADAVIAAEQGHLLIGRVARGYGARCHVAMLAEARDDEFKRVSLERAMGKLWARRHLRKALEAREERREAMRQLEVRTRAALAIQRGLRGFFARKYVRYVRLASAADCELLRERAARVIQRFSRVVRSITQLTARFDAVLEARQDRFHAEAAQSAAIKITCFLRMALQRRRWIERVARLDAEALREVSAQRRLPTGVRMHQRMRELSDDYVDELCEVGWADDEFRAAGEVSHTLLSRHMRRRRRRVDPRSIPALDLEAQASQLTPRSGRRCRAPLLLTATQANPDDESDTIFERYVSRNAVSGALLTACPLALSAAVLQCCAQHHIWRGALSQAGPQAGPQAPLLATNATSMRGTGDSDDSSVASDDDLVDTSSDDGPLPPPTPRGRPSDATTAMISVLHGSRADITIGGATVLEDRVVHRPFQRWAAMRQIMRNAMDAGLSWACRQAAAMCSLEEYYQAAPGSLADYPPRNLGEDVLYRACAALELKSRSEVVAALGDDFNALLQADDAVSLLRSALGLVSRRLVGPRMLVTGLHIVLSSGMGAADLKAAARDCLAWHFADGAVYGKGGRASAMRRQLFGPQQPCSRAEFGEFAFLVIGAFGDTVLTEWLGMNPQGLHTAVSREWSRRFSSNAATALESSSDVQGIPTSWLREAVTTEDDAMAVLLAELLGPVLADINSFCTSIAREIAEAEAADAGREEDSDEDDDDAASEGGSDEETPAQSDGDGDRHGEADQSSIHAPPGYGGHDEEPSVFHAARGGDGRRFSSPFGDGTEDEIAASLVSERPAGELEDVPSVFGGSEVAALQRRRESFGQPTRPESRISFGDDDLDGDAGADSASLFRALSDK